MKLVFPNKTDFETNIIIDFLNQENIRYKTKLVRSGITDIYDIEIDTSYEYYMFIQKLAKEKLEPYLIAMRSFCLPSYEPNEDKIIEEKPVTIKMCSNLTPFEIHPIKADIKIVDTYPHATNFYEQMKKDENERFKKSLLYKLIKWIERNKNV